MKEEVVRIGVYGMAGVGKTTLMKHIHNRLLKKSQCFPRVYWITASEDCDEDRLQNLIGRSIGLDLSNEVDGMHQAAKLSHELVEKGKFVLIIDDIWKYFDLERVGLPLKQSGYKLIFTTRSLEVCRQMYCQKNAIKVEPLSPSEAWILFKRELGVYNIQVEPLAQKIASKCAGLPLAVKTIGRSMRGVDDPWEWRNALDEIKDPKVGKTHMDPVFQLLRFSYVRLNDSSLQQCLLYFALFPEDFQIRREDLIEYLIIEGIIERRKCRPEEVDKGQVMIGKLVNVCLLACIDVESVKIHDLIRNMALQILGEDLPVMAEAGKQLTECPDADEWDQGLTRISLVKNYITKIGSNHSPECPNLSTLLLSHNVLLAIISDSFFKRLDGLKVLDLSFTVIMTLPESISNLVSLSALLLRECYRLCHIPSLAKLTALEKLDLRQCHQITEVPCGLEFLHNLRYLDLENCGKLEEFPSDILPNLSLLQVLRIDKKLKLVWKEVVCLKRLEELVCSFPNPMEFNKYLQLAGLPHKFQIYVNPYFEIPVWQNVDKYLYLRNSDLRWGGDFHKFPKGTGQLAFVDCKLGAGSLSDTFVLDNASELKSITIFSCNDGVECLASMSGLSANIFSTLEDIYLDDLSNLRGLILCENENKNGGNLTLPSTETFARLRRIRISNCQSMKKVFPRGLLQKLQNLEEILVHDCGGVKEIVESEESSNHPCSHIVTLPKLRVLILEGLPILESIYCGKLICESVQTVQIRRCPILEGKPVTLPPLSSCHVRSFHPRLWI